MNIEGLNFTNNLKISNPITIKKNKTSHPSFTGHVLTQDEQGNDVYKFNFPNAPKGTKLELVVMSKDENGNYTIAQNQMVREMPEGFSSLTIAADELNLDKDSVLGYQFNVNGIIHTDNSVRGDGKYTLVTPVGKANRQLPRQMEHILIDSFNIADFSKRVKRNHFNVMGGTLNSVGEKIQELFDFGVKNILGTPIFGQDNKSSHGYWTTNAYQITNNLGSKKDFNNLMLNLYQHGMGWTADGAFVNEGIEGVHIKDMMNWGVDSPFFSMFETTDIGNEPFRFGILSKQSSVNEHTHIKLVNAPYKIEYVKTENGYKEGNIVSASYDSSKPTYIQVFDDRLASEKQINGNSIFDVYDNKDTGDNFEIANYKDSVQAYHFKVSPNIVKDNYKKYKEVRTKFPDAQFKDNLTEWPNFKIVPSNKDGGISLWNGNVDIAKKRFFTPDSALLDKKLSPKQKIEMLAAQYQVQDDITQIGKFWTGEVSRNLVEYTAKQIGDKVKVGKDYDVAIKELINEKKLSKEALMVTEKGKNGSPLDNILAFNVFNERNYSLKPTKEPVSITDGMMSYPFEAIEFSPDLVSVLSYPYIKNLAVTEDTIGMSRFDMFNMGKSYYDKMPEKFRDLYQKTDGILANDMSNQAKNIMQELQNKTGKTYLENDGQLTQEGKEVYGLIAPDIAKFLMVSALAPEIKPEKNDKMLDYDVKKLSKVDLNSLKLQYEVSPEDVTVKLLEKIQNGLKNIPTDSKKGFVNQLYKRIENVDSDSVNVAKLIVEKTEAGLDWRIDAAKDVGDWDAVDVDSFDENKNENKMLGFWNKFNKAVREYNPHSFTIGELTDLSMDKFQFAMRTEFSAISDYEGFYETMPALYGQNWKGLHYDPFKPFEDCDDRLGGNISDVLNNKFKGYFGNGFAENLNFMHRFVGNHDLPRILHLLAMDVNGFKVNKGKAMSDTLKRGFYSSDEFNKLDPKFKTAIESSMSTIREGSHKNKGVEKEFDSENFGVRPFDYNIDSIIEEAVNTNPEFKNYADKNKETINRLKANTLKGILEPAMEKYRAVMFMMAALPGTPTNYAGDEFGLTGWEYFTKNEKQENRNAIRWDWLKDDNYKFISDYKNRLSAVMNIRNKEGASALVNGSTLPLNAQNINGGGVAAALYRYNDKTDAIAVFHNNGYSADQNSRGSDSYLDKIDLGGLPNGLCQGTIYFDALNPDQKYKVTAPYEIKKVNANGDVDGQVPLGNCGLILLRENNFNNKRMSFKGRIENEHVKLANTKYNFGYMGLNKNQLPQMSV